MTEAIEVIRREIAKREAEIAALNMALEALSGKAPAKASQQLLLPAPKGKKATKRSAAPREGGGGAGVFEVNGRDVKLGPTSYAIMEKVSQADDCCPKEDLIPLCSGGANQVSAYVAQLNKRIRPAGAEIVHFKGEGYRLQNIGGRS
jgi:hypothetical protein